MGRVIRFWALAAVISLVASEASAWENIKHQSVSKTVLTGEKTQLGTNWHINPDCSFADLPATHIIEAPKHGRLQILHSKIFPNAKGLFAKCRTVRVNGLVAYYRSKPGYVGTDQVILRAPYGDGKVAETVINITVVK